jgi:hypothetical protein
MPQKKKKRKEKERKKSSPRATAKSCPTNRMLYGDIFEC